MKAGGQAGQPRSIWNVADPSNVVDGMAATRLLLVRHAETLDNLEMRLSGWTDTDLSPHGEAQVRVLAEHFNREHSGVAALYASPLIRARRTAEAIGALTGHTPVFQDDLREMYFGELDGRPFEELKSAYADLLKADSDAEAEDFVWPNGESRSGFGRRILAGIQHIARAHLGESVGVITHGGVIAVFLTHLHGESGANWRRWVVPNASLTEVLWDPHNGVGTMVRHGDRAHLADLVASQSARPF
jgi:broad specificity phosphatase PhoE